MEAPIPQLIRVKWPTRTEITDSELLDSRIIINSSTIKIHYNNMKKLKVR